MQVLSLQQRENHTAEHSEFLGKNWAVVNYMQHQGLHEEQTLPLLYHFIDMSARFPDWNTLFVGFPDFIENRYVHRKGVAHILYPPIMLCSVLQLTDTTYYHALSWTC